MSQLSFSSDGKMLASIGMDDDKTMAIWRSDSGTWRDGRLLTTHKTGRTKILFVHFTGQDEYQIITGGVVGSGNIKFWKLLGSTLYCEKAFMGIKGKVQPMLCAATVGAGSISELDGTVSSGVVVTGTVTGEEGRGI